ncbi:Trafficking protein particle complex subunit 8 [Chlorella vulgaris]
MERLQIVKAELQRSHCPAIMVLAHPQVEAACNLNGLTLAELLRPFGVIRQLNGTVGVPVRTPAEHPLRLHSWRLRFYTAETMFQPAPEAADEYLRGVLSAAASEVAGSDVPDLQGLLDCAARREDPPCPWYRRYRGEYLRLLQFGEHESLDHPVACVLALPADQPGDLPAAFAALWRHAVLPPLMQAGVMESAGVLRHHVLVHDGASQGPEVLVAARERLRTLAGSLGSSCQLLSINTGSGQGPPPGHPPWVDLLHGCLPGGGGGEAAQRVAVPAGGLGAWLSGADLSSLAAFVQELSVRCLLPHMETRLRALNTQVTTNRKGLKNQLKSLLWRKTASADAGSGPGTSASGSGSGGGAGSGSGSGSGGAAASSLAPGSVECQMRQLSDLALLLGDYETATSTLRLLAADTKADRGFKAYAGALEALGAAAVLSGAPPSEAVSSYREALHRYSQLSQANPRNREGVRYATRAALLVSAYLRALGQYGEANTALMKAHFQEDNLRAGLLLEQAAHCLLALSPPHTRKFAFNLVLAGLRFDMSEQRELSGRAYTQVAGVYAGRQWALIEEHLSDTLGRQAREGGDAATAVRHYMDMLYCPHNNLYCQNLYLQQFMDALQQAQAQLGFPLVLPLPLPQVSCERVGLQHDGQTCYCSVDARQVEGGVWAALDSALQPTAEPQQGGSSWLEGGSRPRLADGDAGALSCCVGEAVGVDVVLHNPLHLHLHTTRLRLACTCDPQPPAGGAGERSAAGEDGGQQQQGSQQGFQVYEESVTLQAGERVTVHLRVVPLRPGTLHVHGVAWLLNGTAHGTATFRTPHTPPARRGSSARLPADTDAAPAPRSAAISLAVLPPMPRLEVSLAGLPPTLLAGEVVCCSMRLRNSGAMTLQHLTMAAPASAGIHLGSGAANGLPAAQQAAGGGGASPAVAQQSSGGVAEAEAADGNGGPSPCPPPSASASASASPSPHLTQALPPPSLRRGAAVFQLPSVRLGVGQEVTLPVWFRAAHAGATHLVVAWRYEPLVRLDTLSCRTARFAQAVQALPSLHLSARLAAGLAGCALGGCLLQAQVHNCWDEGLQVAGLACHSTKWRLCQSSSLNSAGSLLVAPDASAVLHRQLVVTEGAAAGQAQHSGGAQAPAMSAGEAGLLEASRQAAAMAPAAPKHLQPPAQQQQQQQQWHSPQQQQQQKHKRQQQDAEGADVVVVWQVAGRAGTPTRRGFTALHGQRLHAAPPIDVQLRGAASVAHDFEAAPLCMLPLSLLLRNTMAAPAAVCVELGRLPGEGGPVPPSVPTWQPRATPLTDGGAATPSSGSVLLAAAAALPPVRQHIWCGRTRVTLPAVAPGGVVQVPLLVAVTRPGKLSLADCHVSWHFAGQPPHVSGSCRVPAHHCTVLAAVPALP